MNDYNGRLHGLDHLRAAAIVLVLLFHYNFYYGVPQGWVAFSRFGWSGVDLFFVLSGYLIADKLFRGFEAQGRINFRGFFVNRFLRIIPAYIAVVAVYFSFPDLQEGRGLQPIWRFLTFSQNISIDLYKNSFSHAWSLCVEMHFYLLLPIMLYFVFPGKKFHVVIYLFITIAVAGVIVRYFFWQAFVASEHGPTRIMTALKHIYYPTYCRLDGLLVGVTIAATFKYHPSLKDKLLKHCNGLLVFSMGLLIATYLLFGGSLVSQKFTSLTAAVFGFPIVSLAYGLMVVAAMSPNCPVFRYKFWPTAQLATLSYSIYLSHKIVYHIVNMQTKLVFKPDSYRVFAVCLLGAILFGLILYWMVEKPFLVMRKKLQRRAAFRLSGMR